MEIEDLIPPRDRMRLIGEVMSVNNDGAVMSSLVTEEWPLYRDGSVDALVTIELVAQTVALLEGWKRLQSGREGASDWMVGVKKTADFRLLRIPLHATLITEAGKDYAMESYAVFAGTVRLGEEELAVVSFARRRMLERFHQRDDRRRGSLIAKGSKRTSSERGKKWKS